MTDGEADIRERLEALRQEYLRQLPQKFDELDAAWRDAERGDVASLRLLHQRAHSLVGSAATFGLDVLSQAARKLERHVKPLVANGEVPGANALGRISVLLRGAASAAGFPPGAYGGELPASSGDERDNRLVFLVEDDAVLARQLAAQLGHFGYITRVFERVSDARGALATDFPAALIVDAVFGDVSEVAVAEGLGGAQSPPLIFISEQDDFAARLRAVREGGCAYMAKPVEIAGLVDTLDGLTNHGQPEPFRVMIVENAPAVAADCAAILEEAGMAVRRVTDPLEIMTALDDFSPELILVDMCMQGASGEEVAKVLRQRETLVGVPIVFLSPEGADRRDSAVGLGADDCLTQPVRPERLVACVKGRVERYRILRGFMVRDSLTGLLNHTKIKEQLDVELARAIRQGRPMSYAMIDLDRFKRVNDSYGHATGDRVLKSLSHLLRQRLRKVDIVGRYGGEEFAVILTDTEGRDAVRVLDSIREDLAQIPQRSNGFEFTVSFSCGVAAFPDFRTAEEIGDAADKALYLAKREGRNRVVLASSTNS